PYFLVIIITSSPPIAAIIRRRKSPTAAGHRPSPADRYRVPTPAVAPSRAQSQRPATPDCHRECPATSRVLPASPARICCSPSPIARSQRLSSSRTSYLARPGDLQCTPAWSQTRSPQVLMNRTIREGTHVREHVLAMMAQLNELEVLGAFIDGETQVDIVLQSLPKSFEQFRLNYNMNKMLMTLPELVAELQAAEILFRLKTQAMVAQRGEASTSKAPKGKKRKKSAGKGKEVISDVKPRQKAKKPKGKCYNYQQKGHWKANCPLPKKPEKGTPFALVVETCLAVLSTNTWCVDTGATDHVCNSLQEFQETKATQPGIPWRLETGAESVRFQEITTFQVSHVSYFISHAILSYDFQKSRSANYFVLAGPVDTGAALYSTEFRFMIFSS
ncbi:Unknown protein, partial [Striga hermonthica]